MADRQSLEEALRRIWGYDHFRYPQGEVIDCLLAGRDCLVVLPTGGGKSICFQLPALLGEGLTLVVSPLVALMEDQVQSLRRQNLPAACLHSQLSRPERKHVLYQLGQQQLKLLYLSPETLLSEPVWNLLRQPQVKLQGIMLDEAHCLVQWGDSFRPAYRRLGALRRGLGRDKDEIPLAAFTATADRQQQDLIIAGLNLRSPECFQVSPHRPQLHLKVKTVLSEYCRRQQLRRFLLKHLQETGLVYVRTRTMAIHLAQWLQERGFDSEAYHGGLGPHQRRQLEQKWLTGQISSVVCTNAFGLGIDKPDTRWVLHYQAPLMLMDYLQEVGRAGRDLQPAECLTLISEPTGWLDSGDRQLRRYFLSQASKCLQRAEALSKQIPSRGNLGELKPHFPDVEMALAWLHRRGHLEWLDPFNYCINPGHSHANPLEELKSQYRLMKQYLNGSHCRWQTILAAFGDDSLGIRQPCGTCDNCLAKRR